MFVASNLIGSTIQITTLPLPVLSTLQAAGLVFNTTFATLLLKEPFTRYSAAGTVLTCAGAALIATFGAVAEPAHNLQQLVDLLKERAFILWMAATLLAVVLTFVVAYTLKIYSSHSYILQHWFDKQERPRSASSSSSPQRRRRAFTIYLPRTMQIRLSRMRIARGLCYALISGILSAHSLLMAKSAVELVVRTLVDHVNQFHRFESWLILLALLFFALSQLYYLHLGLRLCSTSVLYPFVFCVYNVIAILDGLIYFKEGSRLSTLDAGLVALGTLVLLAGVLALSWRLDHGIYEEHSRQSIAPGSSLAPGLGVIGDGETSPLLIHDERTPLTGKRRRAQTIDVRIPLPDTAARDIWAELEDEETADGDFLSSLPKSTSSFFTPRQRRSSSTSSQAVSDSSADQPARPRDGQPRLQTAGVRRASAPSASTNTTPSAGGRDVSRHHADTPRSEEPQVKKRATRGMRGASVHWGEQAGPSRFDAGQQKVSEAEDHKDDHG